MEVEVVGADAAKESCPWPDGLSDAIYGVEDVRAMLRAHLAQLETLPDQALPKDGGEA